MKFDKIPEHEQSFRSTATGIQGAKYTLSDFLVQIPDEPLTFPMTSCRPASGDKSYYYDEDTEKSKVVLHFTAGYLKSDVFYLSKEGNKVSVAFVVSRDGGIYNLFHSGKWSYHLGKGSMGGNGTNSKASVGIELCNIGPLKRIGDNLVTSYSDSDVYCTIADTDQYVETAQEFRGYKYFATHTDAQYRSLALLLRYLTKKYDIPREFLPEDKRYLTNAEVAAFKGIVTHINFRTDGKWDLGPGFDWDRLIADVTGDGSSLAPAVAERGAPRTMTEDDIEAKVAPRTRGLAAAAVYYGEDGPDADEYLPPIE
jgi:N-acetyl-anhydromuramyl-L-alanine amidase AmpD